MNSKKNLLVLTIEGLSTALVGAYGANTAITPELNRLAARGIVLDQCYLDSRDTGEILKSLWSGIHASQRTANHATSWPAEFDNNLWRHLAALGHRCIFITDCAASAQLAEQSGCLQIELMKSTLATCPAEDLTSCHFAALIALAIETIASDRSNGDSPSSLTADQPDSTTCVYWIHSRGLRQPWDAPVELRRQFAEADDPDPPVEVGPPQFIVDSETDPDLIIGWSQAAAAQVAVMDQSIGMLQRFVDDLSESWDLCVLGLNGFPLGEHGWVGYGNAQIHAEQTQVACIFCPATQPPIGWRIAALCQLPDVAATLALWRGLNWDNAWGRPLFDLFGDHVRDQWLIENQMAAIVESTILWLRTPAWSYSCDNDEAEQLYVKPDDRWEVSEVSSRCQEVVTELRQLGQQFQASSLVGQRDAIAPLSNLLSCWLR